MVDLDYSSGEQILCYHGALMYEAKVVGAQVDPQGAVLV